MTSSLQRSCARVGRSGRFVQQRHLAEHLPRGEHGKRLFAHPRDLARDAHFAFEDDEQLVARIPVLEDPCPERVRLFGRDLRDERERLAGEAIEERDLRELVFALRSRGGVGGVHQATARVPSQRQTGPLASRRVGIRAWSRGPIGSDEGPTFVHDGPIIVQSTRVESTMVRPSSAPKSAIAILEHFTRDPHPPSVSHDAHVPLSHEGRGGRSPRSLPLFPSWERGARAPLVKLAGVRVAQNGVSLDRESRSLI